MKIYLRAQGSKVSTNLQITRKSKKKNLNKREHLCHFINRNYLLSIAFKAAYFRFELKQQKHIDTYKKRFHFANRDKNQMENQLQKIAFYNQKNCWICLGFVWK